VDQQMLNLKLKEVDQDNKEEEDELQNRQILQIMQKEVLRNNKQVCRTVLQYMQKKKRQSKGKRKTILSQKNQ